MTHKNWSFQYKNNKNATIQMNFKQVYINYLMQIYYLTLRKTIDPLLEATESHSQLRQNR